jgi:hypothetical protein
VVNGRENFRFPNIDGHAGGFGEVINVGKALN